MSRPITFIGAGLMGSGMIRTLAQKGHTVTVYDVSAAALDRAVTYGAVPAASLDEAIRSGQYILLSLPGPVQVRETFQEIIKHRSENCDVVVIDLSTIDPGTAKDMAALCSEAGIRYVEAPVSGGPKGANTGTLSIMVGTEESTFAEVKPLLEDLGSNIYYLGPVGTGALAKLCNNVVVAATLSVLSEAFILGSAGGIAPQELAAVLSKSVGGSRALEIFGPHIVTGDYSEPTFSLGLMHKDLGLYLDTARQYGLSSLLGSLSYQIYNGAYSQGWAHEDQTAICKLLESINQKPIQRQ